ncbi:NAD(P)/FAD-dependent oxidoreductase [Cellvibrio japonicus]|uniref:FAD binding domain protein n=1 Tax=Cellvibrio japonicus (strain Ueda107) TaxID=498211 RepID=B3PEB0_CELJU|nr:NAD(P)/FAD-dependent oxidoreductase [Cellvibrio japonicus]ACE85925.1 FAD binding domain protein [Cellvibrio japonicus Ueda107]QEI12150.1 NAD(P)/FAD-dependent oxidoreductase [Cellvibrio japonicus]QEI15724.1 NAD(P)/FAD-dependent oxidoreductase [Cellvibrio japonicus]QEI19302.1 NAD(P)/FAD-dependent oxidoreductase [Cellvibrio japonicus]
MKKTAVIIGAGPAGLTAAFEMLSKNSDVHPIVLEATDRIGGISCTINHKGNRIDIGGHRFFSKSDVVMDWWAQRMPLQSSPSSDDIVLKREKAWAKTGPDPEKEDRVMLIRQRISRIFYLRKFFDYPISLKLGTVLNLGIFRTIYAGFGYVFSQIKKRPSEDSLEDFLVNRFGVPLYRMFFEDYTEKVWGVHPKKISAAWGAQRIKGLSLSKAVFSALKKVFGPKSDTADLRQKGTETSLIEQFFYPKLGPGQLWECVADDVRQMGGEIHMQHKVTEIHLDGDRIVGVSAESNGQIVRFDCDYCLSTMPIKDLIASMTGAGISSDIHRIARDLPYRDFMTVGVLAKKLKINNETDIPTVGNIVPDTWIYIQERDVKLCRLQIFNNWSPYMVENQDNVWVGLEYMCSDQDDIWKMSDEEFIKLAVDELIKIDIVDAEDIIDTCRIRIEKAYPAYFGTYNEFDQVKEYLDSLSNLYCIGRNGQHRYNNQDHSMLTAMEAVNCILDPSKSRTELWSINTEQEYHETKQSNA